MEDLQEGFFKGTNQQRKELKVKQNELRTLLDERNPDQDKIRATQKEINALEAQLKEKAAGIAWKHKSFLHFNKGLNWGLSHVVMRAMS